MNNGGSNKDRTKRKMRHTSSPRRSFASDLCHGRVIRNQQNLFPIFLILP